MTGLLSLSSLKRGFARLSQYGAAILGIIGGFWLPPPVGSDGAVIAKFAKFILIVIAGLVLVPARRWNPRRAWIVSATSLVLSIVAFLLYRYLVESWTCMYFEVPVVIANPENLTDVARNHLAQNSNLPCELLLEEFGGQADLVWSKHALIIRRFSLAAVYLVCLPFLVVCLISVVQAIGGHSRTRRVR